VKEHNPEGGGTKTLRELGLTLMHPFFGEEKRLPKLFEAWDSWSDDVKDHVQILLIDDHGTPSIEDILPDRTVDYSLSVYRIQDDLQYNTPGALNLGMMVAATPWILTMDSDCTFEADVMQSLLDFKPEQEKVYSFFRNRITEDGHLASNKRVLPCTILLHKDAFIAVNGFDEDFTGTWSKELKEYTGGFEGYGMFDNAFHGRLSATGYTLVQQHGYLATEWMEDVVGENVAYTYEDRALNKRVWRAKQRGDIPFSTDMLRFKWTRVRHNRRSI